MTQIVYSMVLALIVVSSVSCSRGGNTSRNFASSSSSKTDIAEEAYVGISPSGSIVDAGPAPVEPHGSRVDANTSLEAGDKVLVMWKGELTLPNGEMINESWWNAEVLACKADGTVAVHYAGWRSEWDETVTRDRLLLPTVLASEQDEDERSYGFEDLSQ